MDEQTRKTLPSLTSHGHIQSEPQHLRYQFKSDLNVEEIKSKAVPKNTIRSTNWALKLWKEWSKARQDANPNPNCKPSAARQVVEQVCNRNPTDRRQTLSSKYSLPNFLWIVSSHPRDSARYQHLYRVVLWWFSEDTGWTNEEAQISRTRSSCEASRTCDNGGGRKAVARRPAGWPLSSNSFGHNTVFVWPGIRYEKWWRTS